MGRRDSSASSGCIAFMRVCEVSLLDAGRFYLISVTLGGAIRIARDLSSVPKKVLYIRCTQTFAPAFHLYPSLFPCPCSCCSSCNHTKPFPLVPLYRSFLYLWLVVLRTFANGLQENEMSTDRENGRGNKRERVTRGSRNPKHGKGKHYIVHKPSRLN
jgi:hypothetical protein